MNEKSIQTYKEMLEIILHYIPLSIASVLISAFTVKVSLNPFRTMLVVLIPLAYYAIRRSQRKPVLHFILHLLVVGVVYFLPLQGIVERIFNTVIALVYLLLSLCLHTKDDQLEQKKMVYDVPAAALVGMIAVEYFVTLYLNRTDLLGFMATETVLLVLLFYSVTYMNNYLAFLQNNHAAAKNMPKGKMLKEGGSMTLVFTLVSTGVLFLCAKASFLDHLFTSFLRLLRRGISFLVSLIPKQEVNTPVEQTVVQQTEEAVPFLTEPASDPSAVALVMDQVMKTAVVLFLVAFLVSVIVSIILAYLKAFDRKGDEEEIKEYLKKEKETKIEEEVGKEKKGLLDFLSAGERIRHTFAKSIKSRLEQDKELAVKYPVKAMTARELQVLFDGEKKEAYLAFCALYEKARYSPKECEAADVAKAKKLAKQLAN